MNSVKMRFGPGETGWAKDLGEGKYRINNIPLADDLNIDDEVLVEEGENGWLEVTEVLASRYPFKAGVKYDTVDKFYALRDKLRGLDCKVEGMVGPHNGNSGICVAAYDETIDLESIVDELGMEVME